MLSRGAARFLSYLGGLIGGFALLRVPVSDSPLSFLSGTLDVVGALVVILFAAAFIVSGITGIIRRTD